MRLHIPTAVLITTLCSHQAYAQTELDELTPCSIAVRAFTSHDDRKIQQLTQFITQILAQLDKEHVQAGEPAMLNDALRTALVAATEGACAQHQRSTISIETDNVYRGMRLLFGGAREQF
jgi:hypothetical protein